MGIRDRVGNALQRWFPASGKPDDPNADLLKTRRQQAYATGHAIAWPRSDHNNENLHWTDWNYVAGHILGMQISQAALTVGYEEEGENTQDAQDSAPAKIKNVPNHPVAKLLKSPNYVDDTATWLYRFSVQCSNTGGAYIWETKNQLDKPMALWVLPRGWILPMSGTSQSPMGYYRCTPNTGLYANYWSGSMGMSMTQFAIPFDDLIKVGWPDPNSPAEFTSPLAACSKIFDTMNQTETALANMLANAPNPGMILSVINPNITADEMDRMVAVIQAEKSGVNNAGKTMLLSGVDKFERGGDKGMFDSSQLRDQNKANIYSIHGVPQAAGGEVTDTGSYAAFAILLNGFSELRVQPILNILASVLQKRYRRIYNDNRLVIRLQARRYDDPTLKIQKGQMALSIASTKPQALNVNELRAFIDLPPIPGGDVYEQPQPQPQGMPGQEQQQPGQDQIDLNIGDEQIPDAGGDEFDLSLPDEESTGIPNPTLQRMKGLNGTHQNGVYANGKP